MKILIVNKFFYTRGGAEVVAIATRKLLMQLGHDVRVFSMDYPDNLPIDDVAGYCNNVEIRGNALQRVRSFTRMMGWGNVVSSFKRVLRDFQPDVVHLHNIHSYLSPVVGEIAHKAGIRVVWTLHDLKLVCPACVGRRPDGSICSDCVGQSKQGVLKNKCHKNSRFFSIAAYVEALAWNRRRIMRFTDCFIAPSQFMADMMVADGYPTDKMRVLHNFVDPTKLTALQTPNSSTEQYFAYVGRLSPEKGIESLIKAANAAQVTLKVAGDGPLRPQLQQLIADNPHITLLGHQNPTQVGNLLNGAMATVVPSECFENNPLSAIESLCAGTPVIGAKIGGIPELITHGQNGEQFTPGNIDELTTLLSNFQPQLYNRRQIAIDSLHKFSQRAHINQLINIYRG